MDKDQFLTLMLENRKIIYKVAQAYGRHAEDRNDLAQEIIMQLWKSCDRYDPQYRLTTWMYRIALNTAISWYRKERRRGEHVELQDEHLILLIDDPSEEDQSEDIQQLYRFINALDELNRALMLLYLDDRSYKDIADILGITETNAATKINRIKKKLKAAFAEIAD